MLRPFWIALQFLTRLPTPALAAPAAPEVGRSLLAYPLVGLVIGVPLWLVQVIGNDLTPLLQAALAVGLWVLITGALHLDGLADTADAWIGGHGDRERTLAIMKDPCAGPAGVTAVVCVLLLKFAAIASDTAPWYTLLVVPALARTALLGLFLTTPYVRPGGLGSAIAGHLPGDAAWSVLGVVVLAAALLLGWHGPLLLAGLFVGGYLLRRALLARIGGTTGDSAGALVELAEALALVLLAL